GTNTRLSADAATRSGFALVRIEAADPTALDAHELLWTEAATGRERAMYFPALALEAHRARSFWVNEAGELFDAADQDPAPDLTGPVLRYSPFPWVTLVPDLDVTEAAAGVSSPVRVVFPARTSTAPDAPLFYVGELYGSIQTIHRDGTQSTLISGL